MNRITKKEHPEISVIMSVYNQRNAGRLKQSIMSVLEQTFRDFEFIIYSDGSDDAVLEQLKQYAGQDGRIVLLHSPQNRGLAYSLNTCIGVAGESILRAWMTTTSACRSAWPYSMNLWRRTPKYHFPAPMRSFWMTAGYGVSGGCRNGRAGGIF